MDFLEKIKTIIKEKIWNYENQEHYLQDIGFLLTENENNTGSWYCSAYKAKEDIKEYINEFFDFIEWHNCTYGDYPKMNSPEVVHCMFLINAVEEVFNGALWESKLELDDRVTLNRELIEKIISAVDAYTGSVF